MNSHLILLTDNAFRDDLARVVQHAGLPAPGFAATLADLSHVLSGDLKRTRLVSFGSGVIVPEAILSVLPPSYNFHPGPPAYRGLFP
ncbi:MAG: hypothetical protein JNK21_13150, partial [Rhodospirillaceae bacterium]|nr:hypothetical protein [Rhodospirillaceae bacterium]